MTAPPGYRFDPFADVRLGLSLFQMALEDWLVRDEHRPSSPEDDAPAASPASAPALPAFAQPENEHAV